MERKFTALRTIAVIIKVIAWIVLALAIIGFIAVLVGGRTMGAFGIGNASLSAIIILIVGFIYFLMLYAWAELIYLFLSIEGNVRFLAIEKHKDKEHEQA